MATTLEEICRHLESRKLKFVVEDDVHRAVLGFDSTTYLDSRGEKTIRIGVAPFHGGRSVAVFAPELYVYKEGPHALAVLGACLHASYSTKFVQYEWTPGSGEIRATVEIPLEDALLTSSQLYAAIRAILTVVEEADPVIRRAIETGKLVIPEKPAPEKLDAVLKLLAKADPKVLEELLRKAGIVAGGEGAGKLEAPERL